MSGRFTSPPFHTSKQRSCNNGNKSTIVAHIANRILADQSINVDKRPDFILIHSLMQSDVRINQ